jgi:hypothetical protein
MTVSTLWKRKLLKYYQLLHSLFHLCCSDTFESFHTIQRQINDWGLVVLNCQTGLLTQSQLVFLLPEFSSLFLITEKCRNI